MLLPLVYMLLLARPGLGENDDERSNLRPTNITDLAYFFYEWTGSYYNGTTTIQMEPEDFDDETDCDTFTDETIEIEYENSILAIVESNGYYDEPHGFEFGLTYYDKSTNITPTHYTSGNSPVNDVVSIQSVREMDAYTPQDLAPWRFNSSLVSDSMYSFTGYLNNTEDYDGFSIQFNHSTCGSSELKEWYVGTVSPDTSLEGFGRVEYPTISGRFDNGSAFLEIKGTFAGTPTDVGFNDKSALGGLLTIQFHGQIDSARSDDMLFLNDTPQWNKTLGFSKMVFDNRGLVVEVGTLLYGMACLCALAMTL